MQTKERTLIFHTENYIGPLQIVIKNNLGNWVLMWLITNERGEPTATYLGVISVDHTN